MPEFVAPRRLSAVAPARPYRISNGCRLRPWPTREQVELARLALRVIGTAYGLPPGWWQVTP